MSLKKWLDLVRFSHTVFALPFAIASALVAASGIPQWQHCVWILVCMISARNTAMAFNRYVDRDIDALNPRTAKRHLPAGLLSPQAVLTFIVINAIVFVAASFMLNSLAGYLSIPTLLVLCAYSYFKRFSWLCHLFLGIAIGLSPLGAWVAIRGELHLFPLLLGLILCFWITGFDIIYATQDEESDRKAKLHSAVVKWGKQKSLSIALWFHLIMVSLLIVTQLVFTMGCGFQIFSILVAILVIYSHFFRKSDSLDGLNQDFFQVNALISILILVALSVDLFRNWTL
jgi:4-hydroxybenzoate polyprenyltransferase